MMDYLEHFNYKIMFTIIIGAIVLFIMNQWFKKKKTEYYSQEFWENRYNWYSQEMDWYTNYDQVSKDFNIDTILSSKFHNKKKCKILELGCGNSSLAYDLYKKGYTDITSIDFSSCVIQKMKEKYSHTTIQFLPADFTKMNEVFPHEEFNVIIEKAGLDSIATKGTNEVPMVLQNIYEKMHYVLKPNGIVLSMSNQNTEFWTKNVFDIIAKEKKMFDVLQTSKTVFTTKQNPIWMNLYFYYLKKKA